MTSWIDEDPANPRRRWREMGEPTYSSRSQAEQLEVASRLMKEPLGLLSRAARSASTSTFPPTRSWPSRWSSHPSRQTHAVPCEQRAING